MITPWTILYRSADWTLKKAMRDRNEAVIKDVIDWHSSRLSPELILRVDGYYAVNRWLSDRRELVYSYANPLHSEKLLWKIKELVPEDMDIIQDIYQCIFLKKYLKAVVKTDDSVSDQYIEASFQILLADLKSNRSLKLNKKPRRSDLIYSALYTMDLPTIEATLVEQLPVLKDLHIGHYYPARDNFELRDYTRYRTGKSPGESTPAKLVKIAVTAGKYAYLLWGSIASVVCLNDDADSISVLQALYTNNPAFQTESLAMTKTSPEPKAMTKCPIYSRILTEELIKLVCNTNDALSKNVCRTSEYSRFASSAFSTSAGNSEVKSAEKQKCSIM